MQKAEKERVVTELTDRLKSAETLIVADYRGLTVTQIGELRGKLLEHGARFSVVKNTLTRRAVESAGVEPLLALLDGPTAIAFLETGGDPVAVAKALDDAVRANVLTLKGGLLEGSELTAEDVRQLAKLPPAEMLRAQLVGAVIGPATMIVGLFAAPMRELVGVIDARIRQLEEKAQPSVRDSGPGEGASGQPGGSPGDEESSAEEPKAQAPEAEEISVQERPAEEAPADEPAAEQTEAEPEAPPEKEPAAETEETQEGEEQ